MKIRFVRPGKPGPSLSTTYSIISYPGASSLLGPWNNRVCIYIYAKGQISLERPLASTPALKDRDAIPRSLALYWFYSIQFKPKDRCCSHSGGKTEGDFGGQSISTMV